MPRETAEPEVKFDIFDTLFSWFHDIQTKIENKGKKKNMKMHYLSFNLFINVLLDGSI